MKEKSSVRSLVLAAMFMALGFVLPFLTGQIPQIGNMLCPMHFPVFLCGLVCGWQYGAVVGFVLPLLRSLTLGTAAPAGSACWRCIRRWWRPCWPGAWCGPRRGWS